MKEEQILEIIKRYDSDKTHVIAMMQDIQSQDGFLSKESLEILGRELHLTESYLYSTASFYEFFSFKKKGKYVFRVCDGTTCYSKKSLEILDALYDYLDIDESHPTTEDGLITIETVPCLGACGRGPNMEMNGHVFTKLTPEGAVDYVQMVQLSAKGIDMEDGEEA